jgi:hypothetical protein
MYGRVRQRHLRRHQGHLHRHHRFCGGARAQGISTTPPLHPPHTPIHTSGPAPPPYAPPPPPPAAHLPHPLLLACAISRTQIKRRGGTPFRAISAESTWQIMIRPIEPRVAQLSSKTRTPAATPIRTRRGHRDRESARPPLHHRDPHPHPHQAPLPTAMLYGMLEKMEIVTSSARPRPRQRLRHPYLSTMMRNQIT